MLLYVFYEVERVEYSNCFGAEFKISEKRFMTNDNGDGIFTESGSQLVGNCQFTGDENKLLRWLNEDGEISGRRYFKTKIEAEKFAKKMNRLNPLKKIPIRQFEVGEMVEAIGGTAIVISQEGELVTCKYVESDEIFTAYHYDLI